KVESLEEQRENLEVQIGVSSEGFFQKARPVTLDAVQKEIPENAALIEFTVYSPVPSWTAKFGPKGTSGTASTKQRYGVFVVHSQGDAKGIDLGPVDEIDKMLGDFRRSLRDPRSKDVAETARRVDEKVMQPVRALLGTSKQLLISPDGNLNLVPFEALT